MIGHYVEFKKMEELQAQFDKEHVGVFDWSVDIQIFVLDYFKKEAK